MWIAATVKLLIEGGHGDYENYKNINCELVIYTDLVWAKNVLKQIFSKNYFESLLKCQMNIPQIDLNPITTYMYFYRSTEIQKLKQCVFVFLSLTSTCSSKKKTIMISTWIVLVQLNMYNGDCKNFHKCMWLVYPQSLA